MATGRSEYELTCRAQVFTSKSMPSEAPPSVPEVLKIVNRESESDLVRTYPCVSETPLIEGLNAPAWRAGAPSVYSPSQASMLRCA
jgi:hypothetical protein